MPHDASTATLRPMIVAENLVKSYGPAHAVRGLNFSVHRGEVVGFLGPNGAGKSTTMKMLTGFLRPTRGRALIAGCDMATESLIARARIGYLPENAPMYEEMMVVDFLRFVAEVRGLSGDYLMGRLRHVVDRCGLEDVLGKDIGQLSRGFRQRVGIAQALVHDPDLLILDEPTSGLDPNQIVEIRALIRDLGADKTVLLSTHILSEVQAVCSRALIINKGALIADGTPEALVKQGDGMTVALTLKGRDEASSHADAMALWLGALPGVRAVERVHQGTPQAHEHAFLVRGQDVSDLRELLFDAAVAHHVCVLEMRQVGQSLEETFQRLTLAHDQQRGGRHAA